MFVTCSNSFLDLLPFTARKPCSLTSLPSGLPARSFAWVSNAIAPISAITLRLPPASSCSDSCATLNSIAATPAGV